MEIVIIIGIIIGIIVGFFLGKLMTAKTASEEKTQLVAKAQVLAAEMEQVKSLTDQVRQQAEKEKEVLCKQVEKEKENLKEHYDVILKNERAHHAEEMQALREAHASEMQSLKGQMESERQYAAKLRAESDQQWAQKMETLKQDMQRMNAEHQKVAAEQLAAKQSALQENNRLQMDELLKPIKEQFADFKKSVEESKTQNEVNKKELQNTFEATMKLFQQEQQQAVSLLKEQTSKIGSDAANLTRALKGDSKMQGDWGEMVLETILENSGLRKDEEFFIQENTKDEEGKNFRPDVIVRFPEG